MLPYFLGPPPLSVLSTGVGSSIAWTAFGAASKCVARRFRQDRERRYGRLGVEENAFEIDYGSVTFVIFLRSSRFLQVTGNSGGTHANLFWLRIAPIIHPFGLQRNRLGRALDGPLCGRHHTKGNGVVTVRNPLGIGAMIRRNVRMVARTLVR